MTARRLNLNISELEDGPIRDAFSEIIEYLDDSYNDSLQSFGVKVAVFSGKLGGSTTSIVHAVNGEVVGGTGWAESAVSPYSVNSRRMRQVVFNDSGTPKDIQFISSKNRKSVKVYMVSGDTESYEYSVIVFYR